jgi:hypothetical protein
METQVNTCKNLKSEIENINELLKEKKSDLKRVENEIFEHMRSHSLNKLDIDDFSFELTGLKYKKVNRDKINVNAKQQNMPALKYKTAEDIHHEKPKKVKKVKSV